MIRIEDVTQDSTPTLKKETIKAAADLSADIKEKTAVIGQEKQSKDVPPTSFDLKKAEDKPTPEAKHLIKQISNSKTD